MIGHTHAMMRKPTRPPTARCTLPMYMGFLMSEPKSATCTRLAQVMGISHDSVNRFLLRESYEPKDLFNEAQKLLDLVGGTLQMWTTRRWTRRTARRWSWWGIFGPASTTARSRA